jgi:dienelactone hydrolase
MPLMRRIATIGAVVAAARSYARQNPEKVNRYADQAAAFVNSRTNGKYRRQVDSALRQVRKETSVPGRPTVGSYGPPPNPQTPSQKANGASSFYPSSRGDR